MSYAPNTDFVALLRGTGNGARIVSMPGLDFLLAGFARMGLVNLWQDPANAPTSNQATTVWLKTSVTSWAAEGTVYLWNVSTVSYQQATPALWSALITAASAGATKVVTKTVVNAVSDYGADNTGTADCFAAVVAAQNYLDSIGGGALYFPAGHYKFPNLGNQIQLRSNIEYYGDGYATWIDCNNAGFSQVGVDVIAGGTHDNAGNFTAFNYRGIASVVAGSVTFQLSNPSDAAYFSSSGFALIRAVTDQSAQHHPAFSEIVKITAINGSTGAITIEDAFEDGFTGALEAAPLSAQNVAAFSVVRDMRVTTNQGHPFFLYATYKSKIHDVWTEGMSSLVVNAFTKSEFRDVVAQCDWTPSASVIYSPVEIEWGAVRAVVQNLAVSLKSTDGSQNAAIAYPLLYCQEWSRRTLIKNVRIAAPGMQLAYGISTMGVGHRFEDIEIVADKFVNPVINMFGATGIGALASVPFVFRNIRVTHPDGSALGLSLSAGSLTTISNVLFEDIEFPDPASLSIGINGAVSNCLWDRVHAQGPAHIYDGDYTKQGLRIVNSSFDGFTLTAVRKTYDLKGYRRRSKYTLPQITQGDIQVTSNVANTVYSALSVPANFGCEVGDRVRLDAHIYKFSLANAGHVVLRFFGTAVATIAIPASQENLLEIHAHAVYISPDPSPNAVKVVGHYLLNGVVTNIHNFAGLGVGDQITFDPTVNQTVQIEAWGDWTPGTDNMGVRSSRIAYETIEAQSEF